MDIEEKVANISLQDEHRNSLRSDSSSSNMTRNFSTGSESDGQNGAREKFMHLVTKARQLTEEGNIAGAIKLNEEALAIHYSDKLQKRIVKMKAFLADQEKDDGEDDGDGQMKSLGNGFMVHTKLHDKLYRHQKEGVLWMWSLFRLGKGGILADDMGLGKTIQIIGFLAGLFDMNKIKSVMIVVPLSVLPNWLNEFNKWTPGINVMQFHGSSKKEKERALARVRTRGGVLMTTYGLVVTTKEAFAERHGQEFVWDYVILDEGHKIKNPTKTSKSIHLIPAKHRLILTGTPVQNNLKELWSLFDYVHQGSLLGTVRTFKMEFETPIIRARERDATAVEKKLGQEMAQTLKSIIQPYFLRRTKAEVSEANSNVDDGSKDLRMPMMTRKNDLVVWLHLTQAQIQIYQDFTNLDQIKELLMTKKSPLVALTVLKKICDHPRLLSTRACLQLGLDGDNFNEEDLEKPEAYESAATQINKISDDVLMQESGKLQVLVNLVDSFKMGGHRTLIFSQSRKLLDIIQKVITNRGHKVARLDGTVTHLTDRDKIVKKFQSDSSISVFLLTVQVGGVGLTITSADRVIIYDPSWNPATDAQAVDRVYRIGQVKNVIVYRLITCGTVEEKIYRRQVFKDSITRQTTGSNSNPYRYFTKMDLKELFTLDDPKFSKTQRQLENLHANQRKTDTELDEHIAFLHSLDIFGISDHDLMFQQKCAARDDEDDDVVIHGEEENNARFIEHRIKKAQMLIAEESTGLIPYEERSKGVLKFPHTATTSTVSGGFKPKPSALFTQVNDSSSSESEEEVLKEEMQGEESSQEVIDLTEALGGDIMSAGDATGNLMSPCKKKTRNSNEHLPVKDKQRRPLQTLSPEEVQQRSPRIAPAINAKSIVAEELLISPDVRSPIVSLKKVSERSSKAHSFSSSPVKSGFSSPKSHIISEGLTPRGMESPQGSSHKHSMHPPRNSRGASPHTPGPLLNLKNVFALDATSTPRDVDMSSSIFVEETPESEAKSSRISSSNSSITSPSSSRDTMEMSHASRKLSFVVADSDESFNNSKENSQLLVGKLKQKARTETNVSSARVNSSISSGHQSFKESAVVLNGDVSMRSPARGEEVATASAEKLQEPLVDTLLKLSTSDDLLSPKNTFQRSHLDGSPKNTFQRSHLDGSPKNTFQSSHSDGSPKNTFQSSHSDGSPKNTFQSSHSDGESRNTKANKRRSVCVQKTVIDESDDDVDDDNDDSKQDSFANGVIEHSSEEEVIKDESDEDDKENVPVCVRNRGGRQRIVSDSESEESCYEVIYSDEEGKQEQRSLERERSLAEVKTETLVQEQSYTDAKVSPDSMEEEEKLVDEEEEELMDEEEEELVDEEEEEELVDEEQNDRFQNLISVARAMYKQKNYIESLQYVEEALAIFMEPDLEQMASRIRMKIQEQQL